MAQTGSVIDNKYEILKQIGKGGMSTVYLAMDKRLNKQWAVKEINKAANDKNNEVVVQSLLAEANLMKRLDHPSLPRIVDIIDNGRTIYVIMDYIEGESLDKILNTNGPQPQALVVEWAKQLCNVLSYLHNQKPPIIYRDMKPANIMLKPEGNLKLIDFGIAREYKQNNMTDTVSLGTRGYAAPEQFGGMGQTDARTDIYCLGVTLYHLLTGQNPAEPPYELYPIRQWNPSLSSGLEYIVQKCTQLNPDDRYQNCDELMYALEHYDEMDENYRKKEKKKLTGFITVTALSLVMFIAGIVFMFLSISENNRDYDSKINISTATDYNSKIEIYKEAINLYPYRTEAYIKMLEAYSDNNKFSDKESNEFMKYYNKSFAEKSSKFDITSEGYATLNFKLGVLYLYLYEIDNDNISFKVRTMKASTFFENVVNNSSEDYEDYKLAVSYYTICNFYKNYVSNSMNTTEPNYNVYTALLNSLSQALLTLDEYEYNNSPYIKLTVYEAMVDLLYSQRKGLASTGIEYSDVEYLLKEIEDRTGYIVVTQEKSIAKQEKILSCVAEYINELKDVYNSIGRKDE
jgi:serine/threonine protein kinase